jgi:hypothetical protein
MPQPSSKPTPSNKPAVLIQPQPAQQPKSLAHKTVKEESDQPPMPTTALKTLKEERELVVLREIPEEISLDKVSVKSKNLNNNKPVIEEEEEDVREKNAEGSALVLKLNKIREQLEYYSDKPATEDVPTFLAEFSNCMLYAFLFCFWFWFSLASVSLSNLIWRFLRYVVYNYPKGTKNLNNEFDYKVSIRLCFAVYLTVSASAKLLVDMPNILSKMLASLHSRKISRKH